MKIQDLPVYGIIIEKVDGEFEDIYFVYHKTLRTLTSPGHADDLARHFIGDRLKLNDWNKIERYLTTNFPTKKLGADFGDNDYVLYGPMTIIQLGDLPDKFAESS